MFCYLCCFGYLTISDISDYNMIDNYVTVFEVPTNRLFVIRTKF